MEIVNYKYDVALSFSGKQRANIVEPVYKRLKEKGITCFYDLDPEVAIDLPFEQLSTYLPKVYLKQSRLNIVFLSQDYFEVSWFTKKIEFESIQSRRFTTNEHCVLYVKCENLDFSKYLNETQAFVDLQTMEIDNLVNLVTNKINSAKMQDSDSLNKLEGKSSPIEWFMHYPEALPTPKPPPRHRLLNTVFIENNVYDSTLEMILQGQKRYGITGFLGMGGVGKTYTALKISAELKENYGWQIIWVSLLTKGTSEALDIIADSFDLKFVEGLTEHDKTNALEHLMKKVIQQSPKTLVVLDNAENFPKLGLLLQVLKDTSILITSRKKEMIDQVTYKDIQPLDEERGVNYCIELLKHHNIALINEDEQKELKGLCKVLGGHPLGIRLAIASLAKKTDIQQRRHDRFKIMIADIKSNLKTLNSAKSILSELETEKRLHLNIQSTFLWSYSGLIKSDSLSERSAFFLLPLMAVFSVKEVTNQDCKKGLKFLLDKTKVLSKQAVTTNIEEFREQTLDYLLNNDNFEKSAGHLSELSLIEIISSEDKKTTIAVHPLIREFAIQLSARMFNVEGVAYLFSSEDIYEMVLQSKGLDNNDMLIDILPRLTEHKQLAEMALAQVRTKYENDYYDTNFPYSELQNLLDISLQLADELKITDDQIWLLLKRGELRDRCGEADGIDDINKGIKLFKDNLPRTINDHELMEFILSTNNLGENAQPVQWGLAYNRYIEKHLETSENVCKRGTEWYRLLINQKGQFFNTLSVMVKLPNYFLPEASYRQLTLSSGKDNFLSNTVLDLRNYIDLYIEVCNKNDLHSHQKITSIIKDNQQELNNSESYKISKEQKIYLELTYVISDYALNNSNSRELKQNIQRIQTQATEYGLRTFEIQYLYHLELAKKSFEQTNYTQSGQYFKQSLRICRQIRKSSIFDSFNELKLELLTIACDLLTNPSNITLTNQQESKLQKIEEEILNFKAMDCYPYLCIVKACLANIKGKNTLRGQYIKLAGDLFFQIDIFVPMYLRPLLQQWKNWSKTDFNHTNLYGTAAHYHVIRPDYSQLPKRVRSKIDGKVMVLIEHGLQYNSEGEEYWQYPFYIDETPLDVKTIVSYTKANNLKPTNCDFENNQEKFVGLIDSDYTRYLNWAKKQAPTKTEVYASWLQLVQKKLPEQWLNIEDMLKEMQQRIYHVIETGDNPTATKVIDEDIAGTSQSEDKQLMINSETQGINHVSPTPFFNFDDKSVLSSLNQIDNIDSFHQLDWLLSNPYLLNKFQNKFIKPFKESDDVMFGNLPEMLCQSLSLSKAEKLRVLDLAPTLSQFQIDRLIETFEDEYEKFKNLAKEHPNDIKKLITRTINELMMTLELDVISYELIENSNDWYIKTCEYAHTSDWSGNSQGYGSYHANKLNTATTPVIRSVIPAFSLDVLKYLEPLPLD